MSGTAVDEQERSTDTLCRTVAKGLSEIVRFSMNDDFRKKSFTVLKVQSTSEMERKIYEQLLTSTEHPTSVANLSSSDEERGDETFIQPSKKGHIELNSHKVQFSDEGQNLSKINSTIGLRCQFKRKTDI